MPAGFRAGRGDFATDHNPTVRFEMSRVGDEFFQTVVRSTPSGVQRTSSRIDLVYGAGAGAGTDEVFFTWRGNAVYELPVVWLHPLDDWGASPFDVQRGQEFGRALTPQCLECHNTWFHHEPGLIDEYDRGSFLFGITCERCHGPGRDHVAYHREHPASTAATAIVRPAQLSRERQMDICAQCHSNAIVYRQPPCSFRPGESLDDYFRVLATRYPEDDHVANQVQYLTQSRCFTESDSMTCTTCHNPHRPRSGDQLAATRSACSSCHAPEHCGQRDELPSAVRDNCVGCHMPAVNKVQVSFQTHTSRYVFPVQRCEHRIAVYPAARDEVLLDWHRAQPNTSSREVAERLTQSLVEHWLGLADECRRQYRFVAAIDACEQALRFQDTPHVRESIKELTALQTGIDDDWNSVLQLRAEGRYRLAIDKLQSILEVKPDLAKAHAELGTLYALVGERALATEHLHEVARYDPNSPSGHSMLGWLAYLDGRPQDALGHYQAAEEVEPFNARIHYLTGLALLRLERWADAAARFRTVLDIDPRHAAGCQGLSESQRRLGDAGAAIHWGLQAVEFSEDGDPSILLTLGRAYAARGDMREAETAARQALDQARSRARSLVPEIEEFIQSLPAR